MSSQKKKGMNLERKQNLTGWAFLMPGNDPDRMDELLSDDSGIHPVFTDRYGHQPEIQRICKLCPYFKRPDL